MSDVGRLIVLSGFAGTGKGTIVKELTANYPDQYALSISATTRKPRPGEVDGREYFFKTDEEFEGMIESGELLEYAGYVNHYYGTPASYVRKQLAAGKNVLLEIEIQGGLKVREKFPDTLLLFVVPPTVEDLIDRLKGRGTETEQEIQARLGRAMEEAEECSVYDYLIINDDLDTCVEITHQIIQNERRRMACCLDDIETIREDLKKYVKGDQI